MSATREEEQVSDVDFVKELDFALGSPRFVGNEEEGPYLALRQQFRQLVKPKDAIEQIWCHDLTNHTFEIERLRRHKTSIVKSAMVAATAELLSPVHHYPDALKLAEKSASGDSESKEKVSGVLASLRRDDGDIEALAFERKLSSIERLERILWSKEQSRNAILRQIERRRESFARRAQRAIDSIDADFVEVRGASNEEE